MDTTFDMFIEKQVPKDVEIISRTDLTGVITYANETFAKISGYEVNELIGKPHNIVRHPDMPKSVFADIWETLGRGESWQGYVKNKHKNNGYYWVYANVSGVYKNGELVEYKSLRSPIDSETKMKMQNTYDALRKSEEQSSRVVLYVTDKQLDEIAKLL